MKSTGKKVAIVGLCRNVGRSIQREVNRLYKGFSGLDIESNFFLVESDSDDDTVKQLERIRLTLPGFDYISLGSLQSRFPDRIVRLVECRNRYLEEIKTNSKLHDAEFILVNDFDIRNSALNLEGLMSFITSSNIEWDVLACNQRGRYFDVYALRAEGWNTEDCFESLQKFSEDLGREKAKHLAIWSKMKRIPISEAPISVDSAFGGIAMYRADTLKKYDYSPELRKPKKIESEHVYLHRKIKESGGKIFILPSFTNFYWNPHNLSSFKVLRRLDNLAKRFVPKPVRIIFRKLVD